MKENLQKYEKEEKIEENGGEEELNKEQYK